MGELERRERTGVMTGGICVVGIITGGLVVTGSLGVTGGLGVVVGAFCGVVVVTCLAILSKYK